MTVAPDTLDQVERALPFDGPGLSRREVHQRVNCWSVITMSAALRTLIKQGRAVADGPETQRRYRRKVAA